MLISFAKMQGFEADHSWDMFLTYPHRFGRQVRGRYPTHGIKSLNALPYVIGDHQPTFVHVGCQHSPQAALPGATLCDQDISQCVHLHFVRMRSHLFQYNFAGLTFITRYGAGIRETLQELELFIPNLREENFFSHHRHDQSSQVSLSMKFSSNWAINSATNRPARSISLSATISTGVCI